MAGGGYRRKRVGAWESSDFDFGWPSKFILLEITHDADATLHHTPSQDQAVKRLARQLKTIEAEILRRALERYRAGYRTKGEEDLFGKLIGLFDGPV